MNHGIELDLGGDARNVRIEDLVKALNRLSTSELNSLNVRLEEFASEEIPASFTAGIQSIEKLRFSQLTQRETDVLTLIARGYTRKEIGSSLSISQNTAATHIASIYRKLEISTIAEATHCAIRFGIVKLM